MMTSDEERAVVRRERGRAFWFMLGAYAFGTLNGIAVGSMAVRALCG